ncbi:MAG: hypothetical protein WBF93_09690 [Pirellulales bacterium]|jgi:hypothetical protein|nr:hypothetical protein [Pirellulales bacterium]
MKNATDTHPDADAMQIELLRQASISQRLMMMRSMTSVVVQSSRRACQRANPGLTRQELDLLFVHLNYGRDLADRVRQRSTS